MPRVREHLDLGHVAVGRDRRAHRDEGFFEVESSASLGQPHGQLRECSCGGRAWKPVAVPDADLAGVVGPGAGATRAGGAARVASAGAGGDWKAAAALLSAATTWPACAAGGGSLGGATGSGAAGGGGGASGCATGASGALSGAVLFV